MCHSGITVARGFSIDVSSAEHWMVCNILPHPSSVSFMHSGGTGVGNPEGMLGNSMCGGVHARVGGSFVYPH